MRPDDGDDGRAPLVGAWPRWYALVLGVMAALVALFTWLTVHFS